MSLTAEQNAALTADEPSTADTTTTEETPASGEQPTTEQPAPEGEAAPEGESEAGSDKQDEDPNAEKKPEQPSNWRAVEAAKKAQIRVAKDREALDREKMRVSQYEERLKTHLETQTRSIEAREARLKPLEEALERKDLASLAALGFDFERFARESMDANTPAGIARRAQAEVEALKKQRADEKEQQAKADAERRTIAQNQQQAQMLVKLVEDEPDECPELYAWAPERVANEGLLIRDLIRNAGRAPTFDLVIRELQARARAEAGVAQKRTSGLKQQKSPNASDAGSAGKADAHRTSAGGPPPALSSQTASQRTPTPPREKTEEEVDEECKAMLRGIRR